MGMNIIQLGRGTGTEEVFLVHGVLAVGEWSSSDGSNNMVSWNYCPNVGKSSQLYSDTKIRGLGGLMDAWCETHSRP
jgi:hypothetical protein